MYPLNIPTILINNRNIMVHYIEKWYTIQIYIQLGTETAGHIILKGKTKRHTERHKGER